MKARLLVLFCLVFAACGGPPPPNPGARPPGPPPAEPGTGGPRPTGRPGQGPAVSPPAAPRPFDESLLRGKEFLLEVTPRDALAQDRVLGPLDAPADVVVVVNRWFTAVRTGVWDEGLVEARWAAYLKAWAHRYQKDLGAGPVIVGRPLVQGRLNMVPVRLPAGDHDWTGWVVLGPGEPGRWLVSDVQVQSQTADPGPFNPEGRRQPISSPIRR